MKTDLIILILSSVTNLLLGLIVLLRNPKKAANRRFVFLSASLIIWTLFNYLADHARFYNLVFTRLTFIGGILAIYSVLLFLANFPNEKLFRNSRLLKANGTLAAFLLVSSLTPYFVSSVAKTTQGVSITTSFLYYFFLFYVLTSLIMLGVIIFRQWNDAKTLTERSQIRLISIGIILYAVFAITSNVLLPAVIDSWSSSRFGPAFTLFFIALTAYTIVKHKLFDIKGFVIRAAAYFLTFAVLALLYVVPAVVLTGIVLEIHLTASAYLVLVIITLITSLLFQPLRLSFNKLTNRYFYRDYYEPQDLIDKISQLLVVSVDLKEIETKSTNIIKETLKSVSVHYLLNFKEENDNKLLNLLEASRKDILVSDEPSTHRDTELGALLRAHETALVIRLRTTHETLGFIMLGYKRSGSSYSSADLRVLSIAADEIAIGVQNALRFEEIKQFNVTLQQKVEDATKKLREANVRLKELDATKDEFISMASHQLRTPLTTIKGYLSMILDGDVGKVKATEKEMVQHAYDSAQRMVYLIADLLNVSRLQSGKFVIDNKPTNLTEVVAGEVQQLREQAANRKIIMTYNPPHSFPILNLDETKMRQVIMNFLDNALYYTPENGEVTVALETTKDTASFTVSDTGVGVPKEIQHHLFTKFYRADNARKMRPDGTGLGLYMAKKVIVAQSGAIIFKSVEGKGSTFGFSFPLSTTEVKK